MDFCLNDLKFFAEILNTGREEKNPLRLLSKSQKFKICTVFILGGWIMSENLRIETPSTAVPKQEGIIITHTDKLAVLESKGSGQGQLKQNRGKSSITFTVCMEKSSTSLLPSRPLGHHYASTLKSHYH